MRRVRLPFATPGQLDAEAVALALPKLGVPLPFPQAAPEILRLAGEVTYCDAGARDRYFSVGDDDPVQIRLTFSWNAGRESEELRCDECRFRFDHCVHSAAVRLAHLWGSEPARIVLETPAWRHALLPLLGAAPRTAPAAEGPSHDGWVRYILNDDGGPGFESLPPAASALDALLQRQIVKRSKRTGAALAPSKFPQKLEDAASKVLLTEADREIDSYFQQLRTLQSLSKSRWAGPDGRTLRVLEDLVGRALGMLTEVTDLRYGDAAIKATDAPVTPRITVDDGAPGLLALRWKPEIQSVWDAGPGYVLTAEGEFRPLHRSTPPEVRAQLHLALPSVPVTSAGEFLREIVLKTEVPIDLRARNLPHIRGASSPPVPRLRLAETEGALIVTPSFVYRDADHVRELAVDDPSTWVVLGETAGVPRLGERDPTLEANALLSLQGLVPGPYPATLQGDAALAVLYEVATEGTELKATWEILFDARLAGLKSAGRFTPKVSVQSGLDWFDVDVDFRGTGKAKASLGVLIAAWRAGRRFVRLSNGAIGRIPTEWLSRHAEALEQLEEIKAAAAGRLGSFAAPLAGELLAESGAAQITQRWREIGDRIRAFERVPEARLPPGVNATLRDYQLRGFHWLVWLRDLKLGGVLADDMGLGKTLQALALLLDTHSTPGAPSLVVAPTSVVHNWISEAARFTPDLRVYLHHGSARPKQFPTDADVLVTSYALLRQDEGLFRDARFRYVILDEAQAIKNPSSQLAQACHALNAEHRLAVTGTPLENNLIELWSLFQFLMPGFFGGRTAFNTRFTTPVQKYRDDEALAALRVRIRPFVLRRRKDEVARELPPRTEQVLYCELDPGQRRLYESIKDTYRDQVFNKVDQLGMGRSTIQILEALTRLRQACCDPRLLPFDEARAVTTSAKRTLLIDTLDEVIAEGHRTLIFSQWPSLLRLVEADLISGHIESLFLDGSTVDRKSLVERWNAPDGPPVFLISLKAGGTGLNLTGADHVIHLDPWWNPAVEAQATDRAHRIGQTKPVMVYKLVARDTVEEKILELQARKRALFEATVDADHMLVDTLTRADLESVFAPGR